MSMCIIKKNNDVLIGNGVQKVKYIIFIHLSPFQMLYKNVIFKSKYKLYPIMEILTFRLLENEWYDSDECTIPHDKKQCSCISLSISIVNNIIFKKQLKYPKYDILKDWIYECYFFCIFVIICIKKIA